MPFIYNFFNSSWIIKKSNARMRILFLAKRSSATSPKWIDREGLGKRRTGTFRAEKRSAQASAHVLSQAQGGLFSVLTVFVCCWSFELSARGANACAL